MRQGTLFTLLLAPSALGFDGVTPFIRNSAASYPSAINTWMGQTWNQVLEAWNDDDVSFSKGAKDQCAICLEDIPRPYHEVMASTRQTFDEWLNDARPDRKWPLSCGHNFHLNCLSQCQQNRCPTCTSHAPVDRIKHYGASLDERSSVGLRKQRVALILRIAEDIHTRIVTMDRVVRTATKQARDRMEELVKDKGQKSLVQPRLLSQAAVFKEHLKNIAELLKKAEKIIQIIEGEARKWSRRQPTLEDVWVVERWGRNLEEVFHYVAFESQHPDLMRLSNRIYRGEAGHPLQQLMTLGLMIKMGMVLQTLICFVTDKFVREVIPQTRTIPLPSH